MATTTLRHTLDGRVKLGYGIGMALVAGSGAVFSFTPLLFRMDDSATDWQFLIWRGVGTALAALVIVTVRGSGRALSRSSLNIPVVTAGLILASMSTLFILALSRTSTALILFLQCAGPFSAALFGWLLLRERVEGRTWLAMAVAAIGVSIMVGGGFEVGSGTGLLLAAIIPVLLGLYNVLIKIAPDPDPLIPPLVAGVALATAAATMAFLGEGLAMSLRDIGLGFAAGALLLGVGLPMFNLGHHSVPAAQIPLLLMTEIVLAPLWVWIWPGEVPATTTLVGGVVVLASVAMLAATGRGDRRLWPARR